MIGVRFPVYIPSKSRALTATTPGVLDLLGVPWYLVVEEQQADAYRARFDPRRILILDPAYQRNYDTCDDASSERSKGSGPARNFAWDHSIASGAEWHWCMDDNIRLFARLYKNQRIPVGDALIFEAMEDFVLRYKNIGQAGPQYWMFAPSRERRPPFVLNLRLFSCILIRNDLNLRWRGRYNEDLLLSIAILRQGWCTVRFETFLQYKTPTLKMAGGNTEELYARGTLEKSQMAVREHPDICRLVRRYGRWHHQADFSQFSTRGLVRREGYIPPAVNPYPMQLVSRRPTPAA